MGVALLVHYTARQSEHTAAKKEGVCAEQEELAPGLATTGSPRAAWRKHPSEHATLPSPHETPASLSCFIQCRRRGCSLQIYCVVDGTPASIVRALRVQIVDRDFENLDLNINNLIRLNSQIILLTVDPFIR